MSDSHRSKDYYCHLLFIACLWNYNEKLTKTLHIQKIICRKDHINTTPTLADFHKILSKLFNQTIKHEKL